MVARLGQIELSNVRNLDATNLILGPKFNVFVGVNGSGKTSLLEAIYLLSMGRSFRARSIKQVISFGEEQCLVRAMLNLDSNHVKEVLWIGVSRNISGEVNYRVGENNEKSSAELTRLLPVQLIDVNSHLLLEGGPNNRRQFIDWGVFHVEPSFIKSWRLMRRALEQRNASLRRKKRPEPVWDEVFVSHAIAVDDARKRYVSQFKKVFLKLLSDILNISNVTMNYHSGWSVNRGLSEELITVANMDLACGYTNRGPHRADLEVLIDGRLVKNVLSRGQLKIFVCIMLLARAKLLNLTQPSVFLIDDLHAELDKVNCGLFLSAIKTLDCQVFITGVEADLLKERLHGCETKMFHVEQGCIKELLDT